MGNPGAEVKDSLIEKIAGLRAGDVAVVGLPYDAGSSFRRGADAAPAAILEALHCPSAHLAAESGHDLAADPRWRSIGDLDLGDESTAHDVIEAGVRRLLEQDLRTVCLGGDHSVSAPILRAHAPRYPRLTLLQIDSHPDLYDVYEGDRASHACPFARVMEEGLVARLVQVGVRTLNPIQRAQAERFGVEVIDMRAFHHRGFDALPAFDGPLYMTIDLDALDPAFAPGVSHREPGGLSTRELIDIVQRAEGQLIGADIVELNPSRDVHDLTARVGAKVLKEVLDRLLADSGRAL